MLLNQPTATLSPDLAYDWNDVLDPLATRRFSMLNAILEVPELQNTDSDALIEQTIQENFRGLEEYFDIPVMAAALGWAAGHGHHATVSWLLERGPEVRQFVRYNEGFAFKNAAENKHFTIIKQFLAIPVDELLKEGEKEKLEHWDYSDNQLDIIHCLLSIPAIRENIGFEDDCLINWAAKNNFVKVVEHLLTRYSNNKNYLHTAVEHKLLQVISLLIQHGHSVNKVDEMGNTPLHLFGVESSLSSVEFEIVRVLIKNGAHANIQNFWGATALVCFLNDFNVSEKEATELVNIFVDEAHTDVNIPDFGGKTALIGAVQSGFLAIVKKLMKSGAHSLPIKGTTALHEAAQKNRADILRELLNVYKNANVKDEDEYTPLHIAALHDHIDAGRILITEGNADVNAQNKQGFTPLHVAINEGKIDFVRMLVKDYHANLHIPDARGETPILLAFTSGYFCIVGLLLQNGAKLSANLKHRIELLSADAKPAKELYSDTLFQLAEKNLTYILSEALKDFDNLASITYKGNSLLHTAAYHNSIDTVRMLIGKGIEVNVLNVHGETPLFDAIDQGHIDLVRILIDEFHANVHIISAEGTTPITFAFEEGHHHIVELLQQRGAQLPLHLQQQPQDYLINHQQSTHTTSVHTSVSESAENLKTLYFTLIFKNNEEQIHHLLDNYIEYLFDKPKRINSLVPTDAKTLSLFHQVVSAVKENLQAQSKIKAREILALNLEKIYNIEFEDFLNYYRKDLLAYINSLRLTDHPHSEIAKRCVVRLLDINFVDPNSKISLKQLLALIWIGINDNQAYAGKELSQEDITGRRKDFIGFLFEIQRGGNLNKEGVDEHPEEEDVPICYSGTFNKLTSALDRKHDKVFIKYVTKETITAKAEKLIAQFFMALSHLDKIRYAQSLPSLGQDETIPSELLSQIKTYVKAQLHDEFDSFKNITSHYDNYIESLIEAIDYSKEIQSIRGSLDCLADMERINLQKKRKILVESESNHSNIDICASLKDLLSNPKDEKGEVLGEGDLAQIRQGIAIQSLMSWRTKDLTKLENELLNKQIQLIQRRLQNTAIRQTIERAESTFCGSFRPYPFIGARKCKVPETFRQLLASARNYEGNGSKNGVEKEVSPKKKKNYNKN